MGCGGDEPQISSGNYSVTLKVLDTTDPITVPGDVVSTQWRITSTDEAYTLDMGSTELAGTRTDDGVIFSSLDIGEGACAFRTMLAAELVAKDFGFTGAAYQSYIFCSYFNPETQEKRVEDWITTYAVEGVGVLQ